MKDRLYHVRQDDFLGLDYDIEKLEGIFAAALTTPGTPTHCPFCGGSDAMLHADGVKHCVTCDTTWINDSDYWRLTEDADTTAARLATLYQAMHSEPLFDLPEVPA